MTSLPKIAFCVETPIAVRGGVNVLVERLIAGLARDFAIVLVSPDPEAPPALKPYLAGHLRSGLEKPSRETSEALARQLEEAKVDLVHFHFGGPYGWASRYPGASPFPFLQARGIRVVTTIHMTASVLEGYCDPKRPLWFKRLFFPLAWLGKASALSCTDREFTVSQEMNRRLRRWYFPWRSRLETLYHSRLEPEDLRAPELPSSRRAKRILCVGHLAERKGQRVAVEAFIRLAARHPDWELFFFGDAVDPEVEVKIRERAAACGLSKRIHLMGPSPRTLEAMREAAIFLQPSFHEGLPLSLQEAMACGCACVATQISGNVELIRDGETGLLVPAGDGEAMAAALERLITAPAERDRLGAAARAFVRTQNMNAEGMINRHRDVYRCLLQSNPV